jgi:DNA-binding MarR family transcriptional regulator
MWLQMQVPSDTDPTTLLGRLVGDALPDQRGLGAWQSLLRAHASLMRELATDLVTKTGLSLGDFDALAQLARAGGELRMTDLAARAFSSRSGMTRRVDRLVNEGLVARYSADADARGVVVALTDEGMAQLREALPIHLRRVSELFSERLDDQELDVLERALQKVTPDCSFG